jgi:hypothetical protein
MRTVERFAFYFGILNTALGVLGMLNPLVSNRRQQRTGIARYLPRRKQRGLINRQPGMFLGQMGAVNPPHAALHSALGAAGLATRSFSQLARPYMWISGLLFAALAVMGWSRIGMKPGVHTVKGIALDKRENIIHTLWGAAALLMAAKPDLGRRRLTQQDALHIVEAGLSD